MYVRGVMRDVAESPRWIQISGAWNTSHLEIGIYDFDFGL